MIKIIADENLRDIEFLCSSWADVTLVSPDRISNSNLADNDVLLVRSVTKVDANLLKNSNIKFVGTPTSGINHIDIQYLEKNKIEFSHAPGCNSNSVVDFVMSSLCTLLAGTNFKKINVGIVGFGNIGSKLGNCLRKFEIPFKVFDPFKKINKHYDQCLSLYDLSDCDVVTLHTPLTRNGDFPTYQMIDERFLKLLKKDSILINTSRGGVVNEPSMINYINNYNHLKLVLDVWENEPNINQDLLILTEFSTPHIAGHSTTGKKNGIHKIINDLISFLSINSSPLKKHPPSFHISNIKSLNDYMKNLDKIYKVKLDSDTFKKQIKSSKSIGNSFSLLRKNYPERQEINYE